MRVRACSLEICSIECLVVGAQAFKGFMEDPETMLL
jgi:hypothetical protein